MTASMVQDLNVELAPMFNRLGVSNLLTHVGKGRCIHVTCCLTVILKHEKQISSTVFLCVSLFKRIPITKKSNIYENPTIILPVV